MDSAADFAPFQEQVSAALVKATKTTNQILAEDIDFYRSFDPKISKSLSQHSTRLLDLTNSVLRTATANSSEAFGSSSKNNNQNPSADLRDEESIEENWRSVVDVIDELLEKADACLDEFTGIIKKLSPSQQEKSAASSRQQQFPSAFNARTSRIPKPQLLFASPQKNVDDGSPFRPLLRTKPHAIVPLAESLGDNRDDSGSIKSYNHPYSTEIARSTYPQSLYISSPPQKYQPFESTKAKFVETVEDVKSMLAELKSAKEIAVDLEHHDTHAYHGIVSLMQISTREKDWIVDTLKPWRQELQMLNEVFADPSIVKVLHGSSMDVIWLQRDLGLYLVGLFDTFHASMALQYPKKSLKFLLEKFVDFQADKRYQMADWRVRPLLPGMFDYARSDTHYLLYIFDHLRNELLKMSTPEENYIDYVLEQSKEEALQRYERPSYDAGTGRGSGGWYDMLSSSFSMLNREQVAVFRAVHEWRDRTARDEDEGTQFVLSKRALFRITNAMPEDEASLLILASPASPQLRARALKLVQIIKDAKLAGASGPELQDLIKGRPPVSSVSNLPGSVTAGKADIIKGEMRDAEVTRAAVSQFWGGTIQDSENLDDNNNKNNNNILINYDTPAYATLASAEALRCSLPLPSLPMRILDEGERPSDSAGPEAASPVVESALKQRASNEIFTVKQYGSTKKRKSDATNEIPTIEEYTRRGEAHEEHEEEEEVSNKKQKTTYHPPPSGFDYSTAEPVLHAKHNNDAKSNIPKFQFDPYAKSMDGPRGVRKTKKDTSGKSLTFRT